MLRRSAGDPRYRLIASQTPAGFGCFGQHASSFRLAAWRCMPPNAGILPCRTPVPTATARFAGFEITPETPLVAPRSQRLGRMMSMTGAQNRLGSQAKTPAPERLSDLWQELR
jgi:hypothetical protein